MPVKPLHDRVLVKRAEEAEQKTAGGIFIPDTAKEKPQRGEVVAVGRRKTHRDGCEEGRHCSFRQVRRQ